MSCDYFIKNELVIEYESKDGKRNTIFTDRTIEKGYIFNKDSDDDIATQTTQYKQFHAELERRIKDNTYNKMLFENGEWVKKTYKTKYEDYLIKTYKDITKIIKVYRRKSAYERM